MRLYLVRHGQTIENAEGIIQGQNPGTLTILGREQARLLARRLSEVRFDAIYSSDLRRAVDTADEVAGYQSAPVVPTPLLRERHVGILQGAKFEVLDWAIAESGLEEESFRPPEGENYYDVQERSVQFFNGLLDRHRGQTVLAVSHGRLMKLLLGHIMNIAIRDTFSIPQSNACVNIVECSPGKPFEVPLVNCTRHLS